MKEANLMATPQDEPRPCMSISDTQLKLEQIQAAMKVMMDQAQATSDTPVCLAIVDSAGTSIGLAIAGSLLVFARQVRELK